MPTTTPKTKAKTLTKRGKVTRELYEQILIWYILKGRLHAQASREFGLAKRTLTGLYYEGHSALQLPPMKDLVETVEWKARARRHAAREDELARANEEIETIINGTSASTLARSVEDAVKSRAEEGLVIAAGRRNVLELQQLMQPLLKGARTRMRDLERIVQQDLTPTELVKLMRDIAKLQSDLSSAAKVQMEMERLLLGSHDEADAKKAGVPLDEKGAIRVLQMVAKNVAKLQASGKLIEGEGVEIERTEAAFNLEADDEDEE